MKAHHFLLLFLFIGSNLMAQTPSLPSVHEEELNYYNSLGTMTNAQWDKINGYSPMPTKRQPRSNCPLDKIVFGWHPYWVGSAYNNYDWNLLSDLSYFSYEVDVATGNALSTHNWATATVIDVAKANGVRVNLCVTLFSGHATFFGNPTAQQTLISNLISMIQSRGADGVNIDFEGIPSSQKTKFTDFMIDLSTQMHAAIPGSQVSSVLYAVDWNNVFDVATLAPYVDLFIIMGYDYYWTNSTTAGPNDPLYHYISNSYQYSLSRSITDYMSKGLPADQLVLGLPYYGREWTVAGNTIPSATTGSGVARTYKTVQDNNSGNYNNRQWHAPSETPYYSFNDGTDWRQCFAMDEDGLEKRLEVVQLRGLAGMGIWALGYDDGYNELWNVIEDKMTTCRVEACVDTLYDMGGPDRNYYNKEEYIYTLNPQNGAYPLSLNFTTFDVELNYDYLKLYDGVDTTAPLIGVYTGTSSPGSLTANSGAVTFWFDSDGATTAPGWEVIYNCNLPANILPDTVILGSSSGTQLNCGNTYHWLYDSGGKDAHYNNNENIEQTFCNNDTTKAIRISFRPNPTADEQLKLSSTTTGNDYIYLYNGANSAANLIGVYTGTTSAAPQPGSFISSHHCLTVKMETDASTTNEGFQARLYCSDKPNMAAPVLVGGAAGTATFTDQGGLSANYNNNENYTTTYCPDASTPTGEVVWAVFNNAIEIERNWDYLYVFDGDNTETSRLIGVYTGDSLNQNVLGTIKASAENTSGCLTFQFYSDGATTAQGWEVLMQTGKARKAYGADDCMNATAILEENTTYAGSTMLATGQPDGPDPSLNISLASLPECSGSNTITRLENTIWYTFTTVDTFCIANQIAVQLDNISCQSTSGAGSGVQFVLYEVSSCQNGSTWGSPIYCADKLVSGDSVIITSLLQPSTTYYIMIDGFSGQHCNFDIQLENKDSTACIFTGIRPNSVTVEEFRAYPNPTSNFLNLEYHQAPQGAALLNIIDITGRIVQQEQLYIEDQNWEHQLKLNSLPQGVYIYQLKTTGKQQVGKFRKL
jgi:spore germination protein YaaH